MAIGGTAVGLAGFWVAREELGLVLPLLNVNDVYIYICHGQANEYFINATWRLMVGI